MLKFIFTEDYKIFKKGTKISFYDKKKHAYTIIGLNESGKSLFLNLLTDIFSHNRLDKELSCEISFSIIKGNSEIIRKVVINQGKFDYSKMKLDDTTQNIDSVEVLLENLYTMLRSCYEENTNIIEEAFERKMLLANEIENLTIEKMIELYIEFENYFEIFLFNLIDFKKEELEEYPGVESSFHEFKKEIKELERQLCNSSFYMLKVVNIDMNSEFKVIKLGEGDSLEKIEKKFEDNSLMTNFIDIIKDEIEDFLDDNLHTSNNGKLNLEEKLNQIGKEFEEFYPNYSGTNFNLYGGVNQSIVINEKSNFIDYSVKSSGAKFWMNMFLNLYEYYQSKNKSNYIILLDEPGYQLHLEAQEQFVEFLEEISEKNIVLWSTHSPSLINNNLKTNFFERKGDYVSITENYHNDFKEKKSVVKHFLALTTNTKHSILNISNRIVIMVEGITDYYIFKQYFRDEGIEDKVYILPVGGIQHFIDYLPFLMNDYSEKMIIIYDEDAGKNSSRKSITKVKNIFNNSQMIEVKDTLENLYEITKQEKTEFKSNKIDLSLKIVNDEERFQVVKNNISNLKNENNELINDMIYEMLANQKS